MVRELCSQSGRPHLRGADLSEANLNHADLRQARWRGQPGTHNPVLGRLDWRRPEGANLSSANWRRAQLAQTPPGAWLDPATQIDAAAHGARFATTGGAGATFTRPIARGLLAAGSRAPA
jgi:uncharacterized protein YjbI with pentapeptide repeats